MSNAAPDFEGTLQTLFVYPIKSCGGIELQESLVVETGLEFDRAWMLVDAHGQMHTQRTLPRMALIKPTLRSEDLVLRAPGMLALHLRLDAVEQRTRVQVWADVVKAYDMGNLAAQWFSDFLGKDLPGPARLVRFDPEERRLSHPQWAGEIEAHCGCDRRRSSGSKRTRRAGPGKSLPRKSLNHWAARLPMS